jgi:hypothetical protein
MKGRMRVRGDKQVIMMLQHIGKTVPDIARGQMKRSANRIVKRAKIMTPEDSTALMESIRIEKTYGERGRLQIEIMAGNARLTLVRGKKIDLNTYATLVHEAYETTVAPNGPGEGTKKKMNANPSVTIGSGFMSRATEEEKEPLDRALIAGIRKVIKEARRRK